MSKPGGVPAGRHRVPGDKSVSHRALMLAAAADGETIIENCLAGSDCRATANALRALDVEISFVDENHVRVQGGGSFISPSQPLDLGNSGTAIRLLAGLLAGRNVSATLSGDASLRSRPMRRIAEPLNAMGAEVETVNGCAPLHILGRSGLRGIDYRMPMASAQVKSAILLAGLAATEPVIVHEPAVTRDHTERMLRLFGAGIQCDGNTVRLEPGVALKSPGMIQVPGDLSSAAFLFVAAAINPGASVTVENVGVNPTRAGFLDLLSQMGAKVRVENPCDRSGEPVADVTVTGDALCGVDISGEHVALAIDEIPALLAVAAFAEGETRVRGAGELKFKESDRLACMAEGLAALGIAVDLSDDGICVFGGQPQGGRVDSRGDHRIAMSFAVLGQRAVGPVEISASNNVETSFPRFAEFMQRAGLDITELEHE